MTIILIIIVSVTTIIYLLHKLCINKKNKFANIINKLWDSWFEDQWNAIVAFVIFILVLLFITLIFRI